MTRPSASSRPRLARGCRFSDAPNQSSTLLMPEEALRLNGPALVVVQLCDGQRTVADILAKLETMFVSVERARMEEETLNLLEQLHEKRAVDF